MTPKRDHEISRRQFVGVAASVGALATLGGCAIPRLPGEALRGGSLAADLLLEAQRIRIGGQGTNAVTINGSVPGPLVRLQEGQEAVIRVGNGLVEDCSIHWHGLILPYTMDGVPGVSYAGIAPGEVFTYRFPVRQNGTYWYHSHSGFQEQLGAFGPLIIDPREPDPFEYDVDHVVMLSDWTYENPQRVLARLKKSSGYYNYQKPTIAHDGLAAVFKNRLTWGKMRMDPTDIADVTGVAYTYLFNGKAPEENWTGLFQPGQRVRLRFINAAAASYFDVRIPGLKMTVVQVDGQNVEPVPVDEFRIAIAETYDVIVEPKSAVAYTVFAEAMDRSGYARGTLAPQHGLAAPIPERRPRPLLTMKDMGMGLAHGSSSQPMGEHSMQPQPTRGAQSVRHGPDHHGPSNTMVAEMPQSRLHEPGIGLDGMPHRVLLYADLRNLTDNTDLRTPEREIELHLTGNMERYMWSFDGKKFSEADPIEFIYGERLRLTFVNDTMMNHPLHLHGMWMELANGQDARCPRKHTVNVKPAEKLSVDITVDAPGNWAFHCHILYHMEMGMFRVVRVRQAKSTERTED